TRRLIIKDDTIGVGTGESKTDSFTVTSSTAPLRVAVAWIDTAAAPNAAITLVNDLNVTLTAPNGTYYRGNQYSGGQSIANPTTWDNRNVEECFRINNPVTGTWRITISGQNVPNAPMGFAYAITGATGLIGIEESSAQPAISEYFTCNTITNRLLNIEFALKAQKLTKIQIYDLTGRLVEQVLNQRLSAGEHQISKRLNLPGGVYFVELRTDDTREFKKIVLLQ
ncbi:MAG: T9SS type A sorting domain-containing protein, partial [candidate division WOR-3 bacterium]|nr:T9SS type A sorting domain-containing protein [candidate division WOR-3 bacterium]